MIQIIKIPSDTFDAGGETIGFLWFLTWLADNHVRLNTDGKGIRSSIRIIAAIKAATPTELRFEADDRLLLHECAQEPVWLGPNANVLRCYPSMPARQYAPFLATLNAPTDAE